MDEQKKQERAERKRARKQANLAKHIVHCPKCGAEMLDHMTQCPTCGADLGYDAHKRHDEKLKKVRAITYPVIIVLTLIGIVIYLALTR